MKFLWNSKPDAGFKLDLAANLTGSAWAMLVQLACVPLYIRFMGVESYGLIGFYWILQAMLQVLDLGLSPTMNREMARYSVHPEKAGEARDLVRTLEVGYWTVGVAIGVVIVVAAPSIATHWIKAGSFPIRSIRQAVTLMGVLSFLQWPLSFYQSGLLGLRRQVLFNAIRISQATIAYGGAILVLWLFSPTVQAFFLWQAIASAGQVLLVATFLWKSLPPADGAPRFDFSLMRGIWRFAAGVSGITVFALILTQADKVISSKVFSLKVFGYYTLAGMFGTGLSLIIGSVFNAIYPRFTALAAVGDEEGLKHLYHFCTQLMAVLILPIAAMLALFSSEILLLWTRNAEVARSAGPIATILVLGTALSGLIVLPYTLQLAYGWTSITLKIAAFLTVLAVPAMWFMATHYGPVGVAFVWLGLHSANLLLELPLTHRRLLRHEMSRWLFHDIVPPLLAVAAVAGLGRALIVGRMSPWATSASSSVVLFAALAAATVVAPLIRRPFLAKIFSILDYA
ncbi:MAG: oligosaccharide flippase family protein [Candidatus Sulfotelmatobacter sp.]|jgi:O-antigen/teichoic acid export membrane protein